VDDLPAAILAAVDVRDAGRHRRDSAAAGGPGESSRLTMKLVKGAF
jgi:hypothetical protein